MIAPLLALALLSAPDPVEVFTMPDGLEVMLVHSPGAPQVALRFVVRVGAAHDPVGQNGLAHLLEHLVFHGSYGKSEHALRDALLDGGAEYNAYTSPDITFYALDAPADRWAKLAGPFVDTITNPALALARLESEHGVIDSESVLFSRRGLFWFTDLILFPGNRGRAPVIGSKTSRRMSSLKDVREHYRRYYIPTNATALVVGDVAREDVEAMLSAHVRWPPQPDLRAPTLERLEVNVPVAESVPAWTPAIVFGYAVPDLEPSLCHELASVLDLRLSLEIISRRALASDVNVQCVRLRGRSFLLAALVSRSYEGGILPDLLDQQFASAASKPLTSKERRLLLTRARAEQSALAEDPARLADALVQDALDLDSGDDRARLVRAALDAPRLSPGKLAQAARRAFVSSRRVVLHLSPFKY